MRLENRIKEFGKSIAHKAYGCLPAIAVVVVSVGAAGAIGAGIYHKFKHDTALYSPAFLECLQKCSEHYREELRDRRGIMEEHDCSADWWEQELNSSYDYYRGCEKGCDKLKWSKK